MPFSRRSSAIGFGHHPFGQNPFGFGSWADAVLFNRFPAWVREADTRVGGETTEPLRRYNKSIGPAFNEIKRLIGEFTSLSDADRIPEKNITAFAYNFGIPENEEKDEAFRRSEILNQHLLILQKGLVKGYEIIAAFNGLLVNVVHLWALDCRDPNTKFVTEPPSSYIAKFDETPADEIPLDRFYADRFAIWPRRLHPFGHKGSIHFDEIPADEIPLDSDGKIISLQCPTHFLDLSFWKPDDTEIESYTEVSRAVVRELERMRPIHVEFRKITFDGPKASAYWTFVIEGDADAAAYWTVDIAGEDAAAAYWTAMIDTSLVV